jgi:hypothetical protein
MLLSLILLFLQTGITLCRAIPLALRRFAGRYPSMTDPLLSLKKSLEFDGFIEIKKSCVFNML